MSNDVSYRNRLPAETVPDEATLRDLYAVFVEDDRALAEIGMNDYSDSLVRHDQ
jgi:hypothetical protein